LCGERNPSGYCGDLGVVFEMFGCIVFQKHILLVFAISLSL